MKSFTGTLEVKYTELLLNNYVFLAAGLCTRGGGL